MEAIELLKKLGMTDYEARSYFSLAKLGPSSVKEIVLDSKLPRNKAYEALQRLEQKNKIISLHISPMKYRIVDPEKFTEEIKELNDSVASLIQLVNKPKPEFKELFWVIKGKKAIQEKLAFQNEKTQKEVLSCNRLPKILYKNIRVMKESIKRGVKVKMICKFTKDKIEVYKSWLETGAKIRIFNEKKFGNLLPRITIFDGKIARMTIGRPEIEDDENYLSLWTESRAFSQMLKNHFMNMWKNCKPIERYMK
jgi:sugar-specific transcriptional regulator TrmB